MANFEMYSKVVEQVFELSYKLTLKLEVTFNNSIKRMDKNIDEHFHTEYIIGGNQITTNLKYRYRLRLSPRGDRGGIYIDWDNYDDLFNVIEESIIVCDPKSDKCPFKREYSAAGDLMDIKCNSLMVRYQTLSDRFGNSVVLIPCVLIDEYNSTPTEAIRFRFNNDSTFDIPISRLKGLRRFLMTYNPLIHAGAMARYMATSPLLGSNRNNMTIK